MDMEEKDLLPHELTHSFLDRVDNTAAMVPDRLAYVSENASYTFAQLKQKAEAVGSFVAKFVQPRQTVAVLMDRDVWEPAAIVGIIEAGAIAAPLDPSMPADRFMKIVDTLQPAMVIVDQSADKLAEDLKALLSCPIVSYFEAEKEPVNAEVLTQRREKASRNDPIQLFYTSGSTGVPKGVVYTHNTVLNYMDRALMYPDYVNPNEIYGNQAPLFYANAINDIYMSIGNACTVYMIPNSLFLFPEAFVEYLIENKISVLVMTPLNYIYIADSGVLTPGRLPDLHGVYFSGETVPFEKILIWAKAAPNSACVNIYGSTESPYMAQIQVYPDDVYEAGSLIPAGDLLRDVRMLILDDNGDETAVNEVGEIYVCSPWLTAGYYRNRELTDSSYIHDPMDYGWNETYYRTGDLGWWDENGQLHVHGRKDTQIKHRGFRMDVADVDAALRAIEGWQNGCCLFSEEEDQLYCFWIGALTEEDLKKALAERLQKFMWPNKYIHLDELPRTSSGKLNRMQLKADYFGK